MTSADAPESSGRKALEQPVIQYAFAVVAVVVAFAVRKLLLPITETGAAFTMLMGAVLLTSLVAGHRAAILAIILSVALGTEDFLDLSGYRPGEAISQAILFTIVCAAVVSVAYGRNRAQALLVREQQARRDIEGAKLQLPE
jgi:K+-sensing histidine kinase KdpD